MNRPDRGGAFLVACMAVAIALLLLITGAGCSGRFGSGRGIEGFPQEPSALWWSGSGRPPLCSCSATAALCERQVEAS
jgi:hypothetical protein